MAHLALKMGNPYLFQFSGSQRQHRFGAIITLHFL